MSSHRSRLVSNVFVATILLAPLFLSTPRAARADQPIHAFVKSAEDGQGLLLLRLNACYAVTAGHVMRDRTLASLIGGRDGRVLGEGQLLRKFDKEDLALLRVTGALAQRCGAEFDDIQMLDRVVATRARAALSFVFEDGGVGRMPLVLTDVGPEFLRVTPENSRDRLMQGLSGSLVTVADQPAGILLAVEATGEGRVIRYDRVADLLRQFFARPTPATSAPTPAIAKPTTQPSGANLLAASNGASVLRWSALPLTPENGAANLISGRDQVWIARARQYPIEIDFQLSGGRVHTISRLELIGAGVSPPGRLARDVEVLFSVADPTVWMSLKTATIFAHEPATVVEFAPVRARYLKLRIFSNWGDAETVALTAVRLFGQ